MGQNKLIISVIIAILILVIGLFIFRDQVNVVETEKDIAGAEEQIIDFKFDDIKSIDYKDHILIINGSKNNESNIYYYDLNNKKFIDSIEINKVLLLDDIKNDLYKYSKDKSKILYINNNNKLISYNIKKDFKREIKVTIDDYFINNFKESILISPIAGYISLEYNKNKERFFSVYGADSGKKYKEDIYGYNLTWADDDSRLCYILSKEGDLQDKKLGYYNIKTKKLDYLDLEDKIVSKIYFKGNDIVFMVEGNILVFYSFKNKNVKKIDLKMEGELYNYNGDTIVFSDKDKIIKSIDNNYYINVCNNLLDMKDGNYFYKDDDYFIYLDDKGIHIKNNNIKTIIELDKNFSIYNK